jgi:hypothetical protein
LGIVNTKRYLSIQFMNKYFSVYEMSLMIITFLH